MHLTELCEKSILKLIKGFDRFLLIDDEFAKVFEYRLEETQTNKELDSTLLKYFENFAEVSDKLGLSFDQETPSEKQHFVTSFDSHVLIGKHVKIPNLTSANDPDENPTYHLLFVCDETFVNHGLILEFAKELELEWILKNRMGRL